MVVTAHWSAAGTLASHRGMSGICAQQSLRAAASIAIRSLRGSVGALVKVTFQAASG